jgi:hypothetical protein
MKFVQIIEYTTTRQDEMQATLEKWLAATEGKRVNSNGMTVQDRDRPNTYMNIVEFPSYDVAMKNSALPETQELSGQMQKLADGPPTFRNLDVIFEQA